MKIQTRNASPQKAQLMPSLEKRLCAIECALDALAQQGLSLGEGQAVIAQCVSVHQRFAAKSAKRKTAN